MHGGTCTAASSSRRTALPRLFAEEEPAPSVARRHLQWQPGLKGVAFLGGEQTLASLEILGGLPRRRGVQAFFREDRLMASFLHARKESLARFHSGYTP